MRRLSWLDSLVYGFQHRWETNPQYRAAVSGVVGLLTILMLCACLGVLTTVANATLAGFGAGSSGGVLVSSDTGTGKLAAGQKFPTATPPNVPPGSLAGGSPIPDSQTPKPGPTEAPTPTDTPTATPCTSNCGGGGGGGGGGCDGSVTGSWSPSTWRAGQVAYVNVHTTCPNIGINIIVNYAGGGTQLNGGSGMTDGSGNYSWQVSNPSNVVLPGCTRGTTAHVVVQAGFLNGGDVKSLTLNPPCG
jgi:hypothetical protein